MNNITKARNAARARSITTDLQMALEDSANPFAQNYANYGCGIRDKTTFLQ